MDSRRIILPLIFLSLISSEIICGENSIDLETLESYLPRDSSISNCNSKKTKCFFTCDKWGAQLMKENGRIIPKGDVYCNKKNQIKISQAICQQIERCPQPDVSLKINWMSLEENLELGFQLKMFKIDKKSLKSWYNQGRTSCLKLMTRTRHEHEP